MTWAQWLVGFIFLVSIGWVEITNRQLKNPYRRSRREEMKHYR